MDPPVVDNEFELWYFSVAVGDFGVFVEGLAHDGDKHVQEMDNHEEAT